jgi:hypothetical protein
MPPNPKPFESQHNRNSIPDLMSQSKCRCAKNTVQNYLQVMCISCIWNRKWIFCLDLNPFLKIYHCVYANIPKSKNIQSLKHFFQDFR